MENAKTTQAMRTTSSTVRKPISDVREGVDTYLHKAENVISSAAQQATDQYERAKEYFKDSDVKMMASDLRGVVVRHPVMAAAAGIGIGYLIGKMFTRRS